MEQSKPRIVRISAYGVVLRESELLLCRLSSNLPRYGGLWTLPGGGLEFGEHPEEGMIREVHEETGLNVRSSALVGVHSFTRDQTHESFQGIQIIYNTIVLHGSLKHEEDATTCRRSYFRNISTRTLRRLTGCNTLDFSREHCHGRY